MSLLLRFSIFILIAGLLLGLLLRRARPGRLPEAVLVSAAPWLLHFGYALIWAIVSYSAVLGGVIVGLLELAAAAVIVRFGPRLYRRDNRRAALIPLLLLASHGLLLWLWTLFSDVSFRVWPVLYLIAGTLLLTAVLFSYAWPRPRPVIRRR